MDKTAIMPASYTEWYDCITRLCGLPLTAGFIAARLQALRNREDAGTRAFEQLYGTQHLLNVITWFEQAQRRLQAGNDVSFPRFV
jgi:hypothetical protein